MSLESKIKCAKTSKKQQKNKSDYKSHCNTYCLLSCLECSEGPQNKSSSVFDLERLGALELIWTGATAFDGQGQLPLMGKSVEEVTIEKGEQERK